MTTATPRLVAYPGDFWVLAKDRLVAQRGRAPAANRELEVGELLDIAEGLASSAALQPGSAPAGRRVWELVAASADFEAWSITWPSGGRIELHDHGSSAGAVAVARGALRETTVVEDGTGIGSYLTRVLVAGESVSFGPNYLHGFVNVEVTPAVSVHVYSPRLTSTSRVDHDDTLASLVFSLALHRSSMRP